MRKREKNVGFGVGSIRYILVGIGGIRDLEIVFVFRRVEILCREM